MVDFQKGRNPTGEHGLLLSRNEGQAIHVDGPCLIRAVMVRGGRVKLLCVAGDETKILREELMVPPRAA